MPTFGPELKLTRSYNSMDSREGWFGRGWTSTFEMHAESQGNNVVIVHPDGRREVYVKQLDSSFQPPPGYNAKLVAYGSAFILTDSKKSVYAFSGPSTPQKGSLLWVKTEQGQQLSFALGKDSKVDNVTAANGRTITLQWDSSRAHVIGAKTDPVGAGPNPGPIQWTYHYVGDRLQSACLATTANGLLCTNYDTSGQLMEWVQLPSGKRAFTVDWDVTHTGRVLARHDNENKTWAYTYTVKGTGLGAQYTTTVTDPLTHTTTYAFNYNLQTIYVTDGAGDTTHYVYDYESPPGNPKAHGFMVHSEVVGPDGSKMDGVDTTWDDNGNPTQEKNQLGETTYMKYDAKGHLTDARDPRSSSLTDNKYWTHTDYDSDGRPTKRTFPKPSYATTAPTHLWTYTAGTEAAEGGGTTPKGLLKTETDENGNVTSNFYNKYGDLARVVKPSGLTITYVYDGIGRRIEQHDKCADCPNAHENVTKTQYDERSFVTTVTEPAFDDTSAGGVQHQKQTVNVYDLDGNVQDSTVSDLLGGDAPRTTHHDYDDDNREYHVHDSEHGDTTKVFDDAGNVIDVIDPTGIDTHTDYDAANRARTVSILGYQDDPGGAPNTPATQPRTLVVASNITYDAMGDRISMVDASGHTVNDTFDAMDRHRGTTIVNNDDAGHDYVVEMDDLNQLGLPKTARSHNNELVVTKNYDELGRLFQTIEDPQGLQPRTTTMTLDGLGNITSKKISGSDGVVKSFVETTYDASSHVKQETVHNSPVDLVTKYTYDQRGDRTKVTSPRQKDTTYTYDAADHAIATTAPAITVTTVGLDGTATTTASMSPTTRAAFDIFGEQIRAVDANGNVTTTTYDMAAHTKTVTYPTYQPAGGGASITPTEVWRYDGDGNVLSHTDRNNNTTDYLYTKLNKPYLQIDPLLQGHATRGQVHTIFDPMGRKIQVIDQENRSTHWKYDDAGRATSTWQDHVVNGVWSPMPATVYAYDGAGNVTSTTTPRGETSTQVWSPLGWLRSSTVPLETGGTATTTHDDDILGREIALYEPGHRTTRHTYDNAGRMLTEAQYANETAATPVTQQTYTYDEDGNRRSSQSLRGTANNSATTYGYDDDGRLTSVTQPVDASTSITTTYEYDAMGNLARVTVPRTASANEVTTIHSTAWNQPDVVVEPSTPGHTSLADRTYRVRYDGAGQDVGDDAPGGVSVAHALDALGHEIASSGVGPAGSVSKSFGFDLTGKMTSAGALMMNYDERGLLRGVTGGGSNASMSYDDDGRLTSRTDATGTASFDWTKQSQLKSVTDPLSGASLAYAWNPDGRLQTVTVNGAAHRDFGYDDAGRVSSDVMTSSTGAVTASTAWTYDEDGNVKTKTVGGAGVAGAGLNSYSYDFADRLRSWTAPGGAVTSYGWDLAGNRTQAGAVSYTFNDRNQVVSDSTGKTYVWSANGWLTNDAGTAIVYDAFGRAITAAGVSYTYDSLDRVAARNGVPFTYSGLDADPIGNGTFKALHDPSGAPLSYADTSGTHLVLGDVHHDITTLTNTDGTVAASRAFDPFGGTVASTGTQVALGYQGQYADPTTHDTKMGARWYDPTLGQFTSRDTIFGETNTPVTLNRYTYANNNPLAQVDPTGHEGEAAAAAAAATEAWNTNKCNHGDGYACSLVIYQDGVWQSVVGDLDQNFIDYDNNIAAPRARQARNVDQLRLTDDLTNVNTIPIRPLTAPVVSFAPAFVNAGSQCGGTGSAFGDCVRDKIASLSDRQLALWYTPATKVCRGMLAIDAESPGTIDDLIAKHVGGGCTPGDVARFHDSLRAIRNLYGYADTKALGSFKDAMTCMGAAGGAALIQPRGQGLNAQEVMRSCGNSSILVQVGLALATAAVTGELTLTDAIHGAPAAEEVGEEAAREAESSAVGDLAGVCHSFAPATLVVLADGSTKSISNVIVGDRVRTTDAATGKSVVRNVTALHRNHDTDLADLVVRDGAGHESIVHTSQHHRFWDDTRHGWVETVDLAVGDRLHTDDGAIATVESERSFESLAWMYDLTVDDVHTYYVVAGDARVLVHNCPMPPFSIDDGQFGAKVAKHASGWGLDPADAGDRAVFRETITDVRTNYEEVRRGAWHPQAGGGDDYYFFRKGANVLITSPDGAFVTILRDGIENSWYRQAVTR